MKYLRETTVLGTAAATMISCSTGRHKLPTEPEPKPTPSSQSESMNVTISSPFHFQANRAKYYVPVNCELNPKDLARVRLPNTDTTHLPPVVQSLTLGFTEHGNGLARNAKTNEFLAGVTIRSLGGYVFQLATSADKPGTATEITLAQGATALTRIITVMGSDHKAYGLGMQLNWPNDQPGKPPASAEAVIGCLSADEAGRLPSGSLITHA